MDEILENSLDKQLPEKWVIGDLSSVAEIIMGQSPPSSTYNVQRIGLPFFQGKTEFGDLYPTVMKWCCKPLKIAEKNDILISVRAPVGPTNICLEKSCIGRGLAAIRALNSFDLKFIFYYLRKSEEFLASKGTGSTFEAINRNDLEQIVIPIPPLPEQRLIVARVDSLFDHVKKANESLEKIPLIMKRFRQAALKEAFSGELTAEWRAKQQDLEPAAELLKNIREERESYCQAKAGQKQFRKLKKQEIEPIDTSELPELPEGWVWCSLRDITQETSNKDPRREKESSFFYIDIEAIDNAKQTINVPRKIKNAEAPSRAKRIIKTGDVIFSLVRPYLKNIALIPPDLDDQIASTAFYVLRAYPKSPDALNVIHAHAKCNNAR